MEEIRERVGFIGVDWVDQDEDEAEGKDEKEVKEVKEVRLLDYACGTGVGKLFFSALWGFLVVHVWIWSWGWVSGWELLLCLSTAWWWLREKVAEVGGVDGARCGRRN